MSHGGHSHSQMRTCFSRRADFLAPLKGAWRQVPLAESVCGSGAYSCVHGNRTAWETNEIDQDANTRWHEHSCGAEDVQHSCFFHGDPRAELIATRVWQPDDCAFLPMHPEHFVQAHNHTDITFSGDSMMRQAFISFVCQMRSVITKIKLNWWDKFGRVECPFGAKHCYFDARPWIAAQSCVYLQENITVCYRNQVDVCHHRFEPDRRKRHICIFNVGFNQIGDEAGFESYLKATEAVIQRRRSNVQYIWRETVPTHFNTPDGMFPGFGKAGSTCAPRQDVSQHWSNTLANAVMQRLGIPILYVERQLMSEWYAHIDRLNRFEMRNNSAGRPMLRPHFDCTHYCLPGPPDSWVMQLFTMLMKLNPF